MMGFNSAALDRHITGNWGEDQLSRLACDDPSPMVVVTPGKAWIECRTCGLCEYAGDAVETIEELFDWKREHEETGL